MFFPKKIPKLEKQFNFYPKMWSAIIHKDTNISLLITNNYYMYDDRMIAHKHVFMCNN